jgi:hypothetical protein
VIHDHLNTPDDPYSPGAGRYDGRLRVGPDPGTGSDPGGTAGETPFPRRRNVQDLLGHSSVKTTQRYCRISNLKVQRDYFNAMDVIRQRGVGNPDNP